MALSAPVARLFAFYVWAGRATLKIASWAQRLVLKIIAWLGSPAFGRGHWMRPWTRPYMPFEAHRWHVVVGKQSDGLERRLEN
jgi:hypothetical protein